MIEKPIGKAELYPNQLLCHKFLVDNSTTMILNAGAANNGKTYYSCFALMMYCLKYPGCRCAFGRKNISKLLTTSLNTFKKCCSDHGYHLGTHFTINKNDKIIKWTNGSEIYLIKMEWAPSDPDFDAVGGHEFTFVCLEELPEIPQVYFEVIYSKIRWKLKEFGLTKKILCTCNPSHTWVKSFFYDPYKKGTLDPSIKFINNLDALGGKEYLNGLNLMSEANYRRLILGDWEYGSANDQLFTYDRLEEIFSGLDYNNDKNYYISCDIARKGKDRTVLIVWQGMKVIEINCLDKELSKDTRYTIKCIREKMQQYKVERNKLIIDDDGVGGPLVDELKPIGFVNNSRALQGQAYPNLKTQMYYTLKLEKWSVSTNLDIELIDQLRRELGAIRDRSNEGYYRINSKDEQKLLLANKSPDISDAVMFRMWFTFNKGTSEVYF